MKEIGWDMQSGLDLGSDDRNSIVWYNEITDAKLTEILGDKSYESFVHHLEVNTIKKTAKNQLGSLQPYFAKHRDSL